MPDPFFMRRVERLGDLPRDIQSFFERQRPLLDPLGKRRLLDQFHYEVVGADVVERADIQMIQRGDGAGFGFEAVRELLGGDFAGDFAAKARITRPRDFAHAALANRRDQLVRAEPRGGRGHLV